MSGFFNQHWFGDSVIVIIDAMPPLHTGTQLGYGVWRAVAQVTSGRWYAVSSSGDICYYDNSQDGWVFDMGVNTSDPIIDMIAFGEDLLVFTDKQYMSMEGDPDDHEYHRGIPGSMSARYLPPITVMSAAQGSGKIMVLGKTAMGNHVAVSEDGGTNWTTTQLSHSLGIYGRIRHFNGSFYIVGESDYLLVSTDGTTWNQYDLPVGFMGGSYWADIRVADTYVMVLSSDSEQVLVLEPDLTVRQERPATDTSSTSVMTSVALGYQDKTVVALNNYADVLFFTPGSNPGVFLPRGQDMVSDTWVNSAMGQNQTTGVLIGESGTIGMFYFENGSSDTDSLVTNPFAVLSTSDVFSNRQWVSATDFANKWYILSFNGHVVTLDKDHVKVKEVYQSGLNSCSAILSGWGELFVFQSSLFQPGFVMYMLDLSSSQQFEYPLPYARTPNPTLNGSFNSSKVLYGAAFGNNRLVFLASDHYDNQIVYYAGICNSAGDLGNAAAWTVVELDRVSLNLPETGDTFGFKMKIKFIDGVFYALTTRGTMLRSTDGSNWTSITFSQQASRYIDFGVNDSHIYVLTTTDVHRVDIAGTVFEDSWHNGYFRNYNEEFGVMLNHNDAVVVGSMQESYDLYPPPSNRTPLLLAKNTWNYEYVLPTNLDGEGIPNSWPYWVNGERSGTDAILLGDDLIGKVNFSKTDWENMVVTPKLTVYSGVEAVAAVKVGTSWYAFGNSVDKTVYVLAEGQEYWSQEASLSGDITGDITQVFLIDGQFHIFVNAAGAYSMYSMDTDFTNVTVKTVPSHISIGYDGFGVFFMVCQDVDVGGAPVTYFSKTSSDMGVTWGNVSYFTEKIPLSDGVNLAVLLPSQTKIQFLNSQFHLVTDVGVMLSEPGNGTYSFTDFSASSFVFDGSLPESGDRKLASMLYASVPQTGHNTYTISGAYWNYDPTTLLPSTDLNRSWSTATSVGNFTVVARNGNGGNPEPSDGMYDSVMPMVFTTDALRFWPMVQSGENLYEAAQWSDSFRSGNEAIVVSNNGYIAKVDFSKLFD